MSGDHNMNQKSPGWRKRQIALDIHSCSHLCTRPMCVAVREAVQAEREACAKVCDRMAQRTQDIRSAALESAAENIRARAKEPCVHEWIDDTKAKPAWRCIKCGNDYKKEQA